MKRVFFFIICCISLVCGTYAEDNSQIFNAANQAYTRGRYDTAIVLYTKIIKTGVESSEIYFNLGNAYYKKKDIANAILYYERAHKLSPADDDINFNLQLAQTLVVDKINVLPEFFLKRWLRSFSESLSSNEWAILSIIAFLSFLIFGLIYLFSNMLWLKKLGFTLGVIAILVSAIAVFTSYTIKDNTDQHASAIIMTASITLKSSPDEDGTDLFVLHEGSKIWILDQVGNWYKVKIADGNSGWIKKSDIEII